MRCPSCTFDGTRVVDSRASEEGASIRRRRECSKCGARFTTFERYENAPLMVVKRSGERKPFSRETIVRGLNLAAKGRSSSPELFEEIAAQIEVAARGVDGDVTSEWVGLQVLDLLRPVDPIGALRFASVYKGFTDVSDFERELSLIKRDDQSEQLA
ncbi:MAG: transcriptional regulator NrdR [Acidimicrobiales bacterium]